MQLSVILGVLGALAAVAVLPLAARAETAEELLKAAEAAWAKGKTDDALALADKAVGLDDKNPRAYLLRGSLYEARREHTEAIADFDKVIALDPKAAEAYDRRGSEHFKLGHFKESLADFDRSLELRPEGRAGHWKRGITCYYAGRFEDGKKQFEGYEKVDVNDVENAVWHFLCVARSDGLDKARASLLKVGNDRRVPMMQVYALYAGKANPHDVLEAARAGRPAAEELNQRLFYAHLYLGLYYEASGDRKRTLEHLTRAADDHKIGHYMWDVARVHRDLLHKEAKPKE
jgi:lipoprotein NlpI